MRALYDFATFAYGTITVSGMFRDDDESAHVIDETSGLWEGAMSYQTHLYHSAVEMETVP